MNGKWMFLVFLMIAAGQDMRKKSVEIRIYVIFGIWALLGLGYYGGIEGRTVDWVDLFSSLCIGLGLIGCALLWCDAVGLGDGCFFLVSGLMLGFWENLILLCYGMLLCSIYCLALAVWNQVRYHRSVRKYTVPFLPFLVPVGIWIVCR